MAAHALYLRENIFRIGLLPERPLPDRSNPLETLTAEQIRKKFRFRPEGILFIVDLVHDQIKRQTRRNSPLPPLLQVLICLRFLASGTFYSVVSDGLPNVGTATVCRAIWDVIGALLHHARDFIKFPTGANVQTIKQEFYSIAGFPNVLGLVDGTQIPILAPSEHENDYVNRKGFHSINCQMMCDPWFRITSLVAKWPGSVHDARIFRESNIGQELQTGVHQGMILGDSGYPCRRYIMVPYLNPQNPNEENFNKALCRTRVLIEQTFGILKRKFACLNKLRVTPTKASKIICATVILHNIAVNFKDIDYDEELPPLDNDDGIIYGGNDRDEGKRFRDEIANTFLKSNIDGTMNCISI